MLALAEDVFIRSASTPSRPEYLHFYMCICICVCICIVRVVSSASGHEQVHSSSNETLTAELLGYRADVRCRVTYEVRARR